MVLPQKFLRDLSVEVGSGWERLATELDFRKSEIDCIKSDNRGMQEQIFDMLVKWSQRQNGGDSAAYESLSKAMESILRVDLAEMVKDGQANMAQASKGQASKGQASKGQTSDSPDSKMDITINVSNSGSSASAEETKTSGHTTTKIHGKTPYIGQLTVTARDSPIIVGAVSNSTFNFGGGGSKH